jgi:hypothetical protein
MTWPVAAIIGVLLTAAGFWVGYVARAGISKRRRDSTLNPPPILIRRQFKPSLFSGGLTPRIRPTSRQ